MSSSTNLSKEKKSNALLSPLDLIIESYGLYKANASSLIGYSAWLLFPFVVFILISFLPNTFPVLAAAFLVSVAEMLLAFWIGIIIIQLAMNYSNQKLVDQNEIQKTSTKLIHQVVVVSLLQLLIFLGGFILLIIPGLIFVVWYTFAQTAAVLDGKKGMDALRFSKSLVTGRFWKIVYRMFAGPFIIGFLYAVIIGVIIMIIALGAGLNPIEILSDQKLPLWVQVIETIGEVIILPLFIIYSTLFYKNAKATHLARNTN